MADVPAVSLRHHVLHFFVAFAAVLLIAPRNFMQVMAGTLVDPDSYMRLVRMQEALDRGDWFGDVAARGNSGRGLLLAWAHVLDASILLLRAPLRVVLPPDQALLWAGAISGPISVGLLGLLCAWAVAPLAERRWLWLAPIQVAMTPSTFGYGQLGCVTHHVALVVLAVGAWGAGGRAAFGNFRGGVLLGLFSGIGIWLSPEAMPFGMMAFCAVFLSWAVRPVPGVAAALAVAGGVFLAVIAFALLVDPPYAGYAVPELDRLSVVFLCLALIVCALCRVPRGLGAFDLSLPLRLAAVGLAGIAGAALWLAIFPGYLRGLDGVMTPEQVTALALNNAEWQPLDRPGFFAAVAGPGTLAVVGAFALAIRRRKGLPATLWAFAGACGGACVLLASLHLRFAPYQAAGAAAMLPVLVSQLRNAGRWRSLARPGLLATFLLVPLQFGQSPGRQSGPSAEATDTMQCSVQDTARLLAPYAGAVVLADMNLGPELLYRTQVKIVGGLYMRGMAGAMRLRAALNARDLDDVPAALRATGAQYVLACPGTQRSPFVDGPETTLFDQLNHGDPPGWLHPTEGEHGSGWMLYEVAAVARSEDAGEDR